MLTSNPTQDVIYPGTVLLEYMPHAQREARWHGRHACLVHAAPSIMDAGAGIRHRRVRAC